MNCRELEEGQVIDCGSRSVSADEIIAFAKAYDPQPMHIDPEQARSGRWGGLISSGWMTCAIAMERITAAVLKGSDCIGSPGVDEIRWEGPVRPGDVLAVRAIVLESRPSSNGKYWVVRLKWEVHNQHGERVMYLIGTTLFGR